MRLYTIYDCTNYSLQPVIDYFIHLEYYNIADNYLTSDFNMKHFASFVSFAGFICGIKTEKP